MIKLSNTQLWVHDQDEALAFYTEKLGFEVGLQGVGSFTTSFKRMYGMTPTEYRSDAPPASAHAVVPACVVRVYARPQHRTIREDSRPERS